MLAITLFVSTLASAYPTMPRECSYCGIYAGPNVAMVLDPYLRQPDIWPEFYASTCQFEVARGSFVTLNRTACSSEANYRATRGIR